MARKSWADVTEEEDQVGFFEFCDVDEFEELVSLVCKLSLLLLFSPVHGTGESNDGNCINGSFAVVLRANCHISCFGQVTSGGGRG